MIDRNLGALIDFVEGGLASAPNDLQNSLTEIGAQRLRIVAIKILGWMASQHRLGNSFRLNINKKYEWVQDLIYLSARGMILDGLIVVDDSAAFLRPDLSEGLRDELLAFVYARYRPPLVT